MVSETTVLIYRPAKHLDEQRAIPKIISNNANKREPTKMTHNSHPYSKYIPCNSNDYKVISSINEDIPNA